MSSVIADTNLFTVIEHIAYFPLPSLASALMVVVPLETAVTFPSASTVATEVSEEVHLMVLSAALEGLIVTTSVSSSPSFKVKYVLFNDMLLTGTETVTTHVAVFS